MGIKIFLVGLLMGLGLGNAQPLTNKGGDPCPGFEGFDRDEWVLNRVNFMHKDTYQLPLEPEESINCVYTPDGFRAELWTSEVNEAAQIHAVMSFNWDEQGRMWAAETFDYPNELKDQYTGNDRIRILEDTDGDGEADKATTFVEGLNILQGITFIPEGVLVIARPHVILYKDENGDDKADDPKGEIILTGFNGGDTHGGLGNLTYAMDGWVYASNGYNRADVTGKNLEGTVVIQNGPLRFKPDGSEIEQFARASCNSWAVSLNEEGQVFFNSATCNKHIQAAPHKDKALNISVHGEEIRPATEDHNQGDWNGSYTAVSNSEIYTARYFPKKFWNAAAFTNDGTVHQSHIDFLTPVKSSWEANEEGAGNLYNILVGEDAWVAPIMTKVGPDGAVWVSDWYNYLYLHNGASPAGAGRAVLSFVRDNQRNRMYRVVREDVAPDPVPDLSEMNKADLVETLAHSNKLIRMHAQRLLIEGGHSAELEGMLEKMLERRFPDETGLDAGPMHAVWILQQFGLFESNPTKWNPILKDLLLHPSHSVRMNVMKAMPKTTASAQAIRDQGRLNDDNPHVRLWAMVALSEMPQVNDLNMFQDYKGLDGVTNGFAGNVPGLNTVGTLPSLPDLHDVVVPLSEPGHNALISNFRLGVSKEGRLQLLESRGIESGLLKVYGANGVLQSVVKLENGKLMGQGKSLESGIYMYRLELEGANQLQGKVIRF